MLSHLLLYLHSSSRSMTDMHNDDGSMTVVFSVFHHHHLFLHVAYDPFMLTTFTLSTINMYPHPFYPSSPPSQTYPPSELPHNTNFPLTLTAKKPRSIATRARTITGQAGKSPAGLPKCQQHLTSPAAGGVITSYYFSAPCRTNYTLYRPDRQFASCYFTEDVFNAHLEIEK